MVNCICVLTRGYNNIEDYSNLIKRNNHISANLQDKSIDNLIFHEGNITDEQQLYIMNETPDIIISFINISNIAFKDDKNGIIFEGEPSTNIKYRHMCSFWFINFFNAVENYDKLLRIDEDCYIDSNIDAIFLDLTSYVFVCGTIIVDSPHVTMGLNKFTLDFMNKHTEFTFKTEVPKKSDGPYTNLFGLSLDIIRKNEAFNLYNDEVDRSDMIYIQRWGDLPLWGEAISYIFGNDTLKVDTSIKYFHGSHSVYVN
jgi:hypothetical protein